MEAYKERMVNEYWELHDRAKKLSAMLDKWTIGKLDFEPSCPFQLLESQLYAMKIYLIILKRRAEIEGIELVSREEVEHEH